MKLNIKVVPDSSRDCIAGWLGESLKVCVQAAPEKGKANKAVEKLISQALGISTNNAKVVRGNTSAHKVIEICDLDEQEVHTLLKKI